MTDFDLLEAYRRMYRIRRIEERIADEYPKGEMRLPVHLSIGQEAAPVAACMALEENDVVFASHRSHAPYLAKGGDLRRLVRELQGRDGGCTDGVGGSMYLVDSSVGFDGSFAIVGTAISVAVGRAFAYQNRAEDKAVAVFVGDSIAECGQFWEALNFIALRRLPILIVCENNGYATQTPLNQRQPENSEIADRVRPFMHACTLHDSAFEEMYDHLVLLRRKNILPAFVEVLTYRFREHVGPNHDWDMGYRSEDEVARAIGNDPLVKFYESFSAPTKPSYSIDDLSEVHKEVEAEIDDVFDAL